MYCIFRAPGIPQIMTYWSCKWSGTWPTVLPISLCCLLWGFRNVLSTADAVASTKMARWICTVEWKLLGIKWSWYRCTVPAFASRDRRKQRKFVKRAETGTGFFSNTEKSRDRLRHSEFYILHDQKTAMNVNPVTALRMRSDILMFFRKLKSD
jgi:hypothetical protein